MIALRKGFSVLVSVPLLASACGADIGDGGAIPPDAGAASPDATPPIPEPDAAAPIECTIPPPQLMIVLDRSGSFARRPDGTLPPNSDQGRAETRWHIAVEAIQGVTMALQAEVQFGLTLFPYDPDGDGGLDCSNLDTWLDQYLPPESNDLACQPGEVLVSPSPMNGAAMEDAIDRDTTGLCSFTPIGAGLSAAYGELMAIADPEYQQAAVLITDGADTCDGDDGYTTDSLATADAMAAAGINTYVLGFSGSGEDFDPVHLNNLACAGRTAPDFDTNCQLVGDGYRAVAQPNPERLFYIASELDTLTDTLSEIAEDACNEQQVD